MRLSLGLPALEDEVGNKLVGEVLVWAKEL
jgi:hypothetical protein